MATVRVNSAVAASGNGSSWDTGDVTNRPYKTLQEGLTNAGAGGYVLVISTHSETYTASQTLTSPGAIATPVTIITTDGTDTVYQASAAANFIIGTTSTADLTFSGSSRWYGVWFQIIDDIFMNFASDFLYFGPDTILEMTGTSSLIRMGHSGCSIIKMVDCHWHWSNAAPGSAVRVQQDASTNLDLLLDNLHITDAGHASLSNVFSIQGARGGVIDCRNTNLNAGVWSQNIFNMPANGSFRLNVTNCKIHASATICGTLAEGTEVNVIGTDDDTANKAYTRERYSVYGTMITDSANRNDAGATDGTNRWSWKVVTSSSCVPYHKSFYTPWVTGYIANTGSKTFSMEIMSDNVTYNTDEAWIEVEFMGTSGSVLTSKASDILSPISGNAITGTTVDTDQGTTSATWTTSGVTTPVKQQLSTTGTVNKAGQFRARVRVAKASSTVWVDPMVTVSGETAPSRCWVSGLEQIQEAGSGGGGLMRNPSLSGGVV